jgi:hypothetical protein
VFKVSYIVKSINKLSLSSISYSKATLSSMVRSLLLTLVRCGSR